MSLPVPRCVAILRFSAAGDVLLTSQAIDALAAAWPQARLVFVTHARFAPLLAGNTRLAGIETLPPRGSVRRLARALRQRWGVDATLDLHGSWRTRFLVWLMAPRRRARWHKRSLGDWARTWLGAAPYRPAVPMAVRQHQAVQQLVGQSLAPMPFALAPPPRACLPLGWRAGPKRVLVGLSPGAGWATKRWPVGRYAALARQQLALGRDVVLFGSSHECSLTAQIVAQAPGCRDLAGQLDWPATFAAIATLAVFVAGDTGPMHLARGLGVPVVALFTSTPATQFDWGANRLSKVLQAQLPCSPCSFYGRSACPRGHAACLQAIEVDAVSRAIDALLARGVPPPRPGGILAPGAAGTCGRAGYPG